MYLGHAESKMRQLCRAVGSESLGSGQELAVVPHSTCLTTAGESMGWGDGLRSLSATKFQLTFLLCVTAVIPPFVSFPQVTYGIRGHSALCPHPMASCLYRGCWDQG